MIKVIIEPEYDSAVHSEEHSGLIGLRKRIRLLGLKVYDKTVRPVKAGSRDDYNFPYTI